MFTDRVPWSVGSPQRSAFIRSPPASFPLFPFQTVHVRLAEGAVKAAGLRDVETSLPMPYIRTFLLKGRQSMRRSRSKNAGCRVGTTRLEVEMDVMSKEMSWQLRGGERKGIKLLIFNSM